jgi:cyanophycinase
MDTVVVVGGGAEEEGGWSDALFAALGAGRRVAILGADVSSEPGWYARYFLALGARDAEEYVIPDHATALATDLSGFDAFFLRGGDQAVYVDEWAGTPVEDAIRAAAAVGGTSAGAAVLGELDYTAENGSVYPEEILRNVASRYVTLSDAFLPLLPGVITDTHFTQRGRIARLVPFAACNGLVGVGVDDMTGVIVQDGVWTVVGTGTVTIVHPPADPSTVSCERGPPRMDVAIDVLVDGWTWDGATVSGPAVARSARASASGAHLADGSEGTWATVGEEEDSLYCGTLSLEPGAGAIDGIVEADAFDDTLDDARVGGAIYALGREDLPVAVLLPEGTEVDALATGGFTTTGDRSAVIVAAEGGSTSEDVGWQDPSCPGPRLARALTGARLSLVPPDGTVAFAGLGAAEPDTGGDSGRAKTAEDGCGCAAGPSPAASVLVVTALALGASRRRGRAVGATARRVTG